MKKRYCKKCFYAVESKVGDLLCKRYPVDFTANYYKYCSTKNFDHDCKLYLNKYIGDVLSILYSISIFIATLTLTLWILKYFLG